MDVQRYFQNIYDSLADGSGFIVIIWQLAGNNLLCAFSL